jgi:ectoine hydroxylase-related dioxygenase (phytanoyl-CoA dioxygenase family)
VNVSYQLCESCAEGGGLIVVPGGHKASYQMPARMQLHQQEPLATVHPRTSPGDIILFCGMGSVHGVRQWRSPWQRRITIMSYTSHTLVSASPNWNWKLSPARL